MRKHADQLRFAFRQRRCRGPAACPSAWLHDPDPAYGPAERLQLAALASGAFPLLLPPRRISRDSRDYLAQRWPGPGSGEMVDGRCDCVRYRHLAPDWGGHEAPATFQFHAVDGGMLDNQPFAAGRELLAGLPPTMPQPPVVNRVMLAIDPFPDLVGYRQEEPEPAGLLDFGLALLSAMKNQTRFKPEELLTAAEDVHASRQLIAPSRRIDGVRMDHPLAGGAVEGFAGFIDRRFRLHDFWLVGPTASASSAAISGLRSIRCLPTGLRASTRPGATGTAACRSCRCWVAPPSPSPHPPGRSWVSRTCSAWPPVAPAQPGPAAACH